MSTQTTHLHLDLRESADIFNPLSTNANFESLDNIIYEIQNKGGVPTYTTTASANLLKLSENPTPNSTVFKFVAAGDADRWSFSETINDIVALDGTKKTVKGGSMYVAWINSANAMVVIAWPDVVNAQTFDGKGPTEWATAAQLQAVNTAAANATQTAQAAATVANNALEVANAAGFKMDLLFEATDLSRDQPAGYAFNLNKSVDDYKLLFFVIRPSYSYDVYANNRIGVIAPNFNSAEENIVVRETAPINESTTDDCTKLIKKTSSTVLTVVSSTFTNLQARHYAIIVKIYGLK